MNKAVPNPGPSALELAMAAASAICSLPAVATVDWCARSAEIIRSLHPGSLACVVVATLATRGTIIQLEATGGSGVDPMGRAIDLDHIHPDNAASLGWWFEDTPVQGSPLCRTSALADLPCASAWHDSPAGRSWQRMGVRELLVGSAPIPGHHPSRRLLVEVGARTGSNPATTDGAELFRAVLPLLAQRASLAFGVDPSTPLNRLTLREQQILEHLALGKSVKQIAADLARSPHTVHDHVKALHRKLNASSRGELIARALGHLTRSTRRAGAQEPMVASHLTNGVALLHDTFVSA